MKHNSLSQLSQIGSSHSARSLGSSPHTTSGPVVDPELDELESAMGPTVVLEFDSFVGVVGSTVGELMVASVVPLDVEFVPIPSVPTPEVLSSQAAIKSAAITKPRIWAS